MSNPLTRFDLWGLDWDHITMPDFLDCNYSFDDIIGPFSYDYNPILAGVETLSHELTIGPDYIGAGCRGLRGQGFTLHPPDYQESGIYHLGRPRLDNAVLLATNGMGTTLEQGMNFARKVSDTHGGWDVTLIFNATHGFTNDLSQFPIHALNLPENKVGDIQTGIFKESLATLGKNGHPIDVYQYSHSMAGKICEYSMNQLPEHQSDRIYYRGFGTAAILNWKNCANNFSIADPIPAWTCKGYHDIREGRVKNDKVFFLEPDRFTLAEHGIMCDTYQKRLKEYGENFINKHGIAPK